MKIEDQRTQKKIYRTAAVMNIPVGTVFSGELSGAGYEEDIYLRTYSGVVSLSNPGRTWTINYSTLFYLNYTPLDVTLVIKGELPNAK